VVKKINQFFFSSIGHVYGIDYKATVTFANQSANMMVQSLQALHGVISSVRKKYIPLTNILTQFTY